MPRYSPVVLVLDVVHLLRGQGVAVSEAHEHLHQAIDAGSDLLHWLGVEPDKRLLTRPREHTPELIAATVAHACRRHRAQRCQGLARAAFMNHSRMWTFTEMRVALAHDIGTVFRIMQRYGFPQRQIAALSGIAQSDVSEIICGRRRITAYVVLERLVEGLGLGLGCPVDGSVLPSTTRPRSCSL